MPKPAKREKRKKTSRTGPFYTMPVKTLTEHTEWVSQEHMTIFGKEATLDRLLSRVGRKMDVKAQTKTRGLLSVLVLDVREGGTCTLNSIDSDEEDEPIPEMKPNKKRKPPTIVNPRKRKRQKKHLATETKETINYIWLKFH